MHWLLAVFVFVGAAIAFQGVDAASAPPSYKGVPIAPEKGRSNVEFIITHDTYGPPGSAFNAMKAFLAGKGRKGCERCGTEWWVMANGDIYHATPERVTGHCASSLTPSCNHVRGGSVSSGCNARSVGIEFEGYPYRQKTRAQIEAGLKLIIFLQDRYCVPANKVYAHINDGAPLCSEGVTMQKAARTQNHTPDCTPGAWSAAAHAPTQSAIELGLKDYTNYKALDTPPPSIWTGDSSAYKSLTDLFKTNPAPNTQPYFPQQPLSGFKGLSSAFGPENQPSALPTAIMPPPSSSSNPLAALQNLASDPHVHEGEDDASRAADEAAAKYPGAAAIDVIIPPGSTTAKIIVSNNKGSTTVETISLTPAGAPLDTDHVAPSTFTSPDLQPGSPPGFQSVTLGLQGQVVSILSQVRSILVNVLQFLRGDEN